MKNRLKYFTLSAVGLFLISGLISRSNAEPPAVRVWTVSACDSGDVMAYFSNWGNPPIEFCAPGVSIESTWKGGGYNTISGTSLATPHVAWLLLIKGEDIRGDRKASGDPDGNPDPIAHK